MKVTSEAYAFAVSLNEEYSLVRAAESGTRTAKHFHLATSALL
jgi:hypothetical protein